MFSESFPAGPWQANCYIVGADGTDECVVIDPGMHAAASLERLLDGTGRRPVAVVLTHGHLDHVADTAQVADRHGLATYIHPADRHLLTDPLAGIGPALADLVTTMYGTTTLAEPAVVRELTDGQTLDLAGLSWLVQHAPGHTPGCVALTATDGDDSAVYAGDVLFAGSIGRMDLPGGDPADMVTTLTEVVLRWPDDLVVRPGHGPATTLGRERATNPYLQPRFLEVSL